MGKPLKDFDVVAHVITLQDPVPFVCATNGSIYTQLAVYINRYGLEIGALLKDGDGELISFDPHLYQEHLAYLNPPEQEYGT